jgi:UDP-galactopyranose mutase
VRTCVNKQLYPFPINRDTINKYFNLNLSTERETKDFISKKIIPIKNPKNAEEQILSTLGKELYEDFYKNYTIKQWNTSPRKLAASITARIPIRYNTDDKYFNEKIQAMPSEGYSYLFKNLLKKVEIWKNTDFFKIIDTISYENLIYTGRIDEFFNYKFGKLPYRSLIFTFENYNKNYYQNWVQINYPNDYDYTRIVEIKHATHQKCSNTTIVKEFPSSVGDPFYPILNPENVLLYNKYRKEGEELKNTYFIGRLATYKYLNMDQVVIEALRLFKKLKLKGD